MPITPAQIDDLPDYSDEQMLKLIRLKKVELMEDPDVEVTIAGRSWKRRDLTELLAVERDLERKINASRIPARGGVADFHGGMH